MLHGMLEPHELAKMKQVEESIEDRALSARVQAEVRKVLREEQDRLYREFSERMTRDIRMQSGLPSWAHLETK